eukprot:365184-Chlamydomonas_euryale.AAC.8
MAEYCPSDGRAGRLLEHARRRSALSAAQRRVPRAVVLRWQAAVPTRPDHMSVPHSVMPGV